MKKVTERQGNIEVLRIISMILIIMFHYCYHGGVYFLNTNNKVISAIGNLGKIASNTYVIITGLFIFKYKFKIQKIIKIILEAIFYSLLVNVLIIIFVSEEYSDYIVYDFFPIFFKANWFITAYVATYLIIPFIKPYLNKISKKQYGIILMILGVLIVAFPTLVLHYFSQTINPFGEVATFIYMVMIGGFINKFNFNIFKKKIYDVFAIIILFCIGLKLNLLFMDNSFFCVMIATLLVDLFLKLNIKNNKTISFFSSSCLGILLLHDNGIFDFNKIMWTRNF